MHVFNVGLVSVLFFSSIRCFSPSTTSTDKDYVYDDNDPVSPRITSTTAASATTQLAVEVLTTIMNLLFSEFTQDIADSLKNRTTPVLSVTTPFSVTNGSAAEALTRDNATVLDDAESNGPMNISETGNVEPTQSINISSTENSNTSAHAGFLNGLFDEQIFNVSDSNRNGFSNATGSSLVGSSNASDSLDGFLIINATTFAEAESLVNSTEEVNETFVIPDNFSQPEIVDSANITENFNATEPVLALTNVRPTVEANGTLFDIGVEINSTHWNNSDHFPTPHLFHDFEFTEKVENGTQNTISLQSDQETTTLSPILVFPSSTESQAGNASCSHRSSESLSRFENESVVMLRIKSIRGWTNETENAVCQFILDALCRFSKRYRNASDCAGMKLEIVDEPFLEAAEISVHFLVTGTNDFVLHPNDTMAALEAEHSELESLFSVSSNVSHKVPKQSTASQPYEHPLDNPVIATSLVAVVIAVCLAALLSLLILVLLQRRRRSRKGEWIVNKKDGSGAQQAYGWCFENDAYANDEKKRPAAQLLDDRRRKLTLPVDNGSDAFPVPAPPPLNSFNSNHASWSTKAPTVELEMTEPRKEQRWH